MNKLSSLLVLFTVTSGLCQAAPDGALDGLARKIQAALIGPEWQIVKDWGSISLVRTNVQFLNGMQLPPGGLEYLWKASSFTADYRITIRLEPKLNQTEYDMLARLRRDVIAQRAVGLDVGMDSIVGYSHAARDVKHTIELPGYYLDRFSVYFYSSDEDFFLVRPDAVKSTRDKVIKILEDACAKYATASEQDGPANGSHPGRPETNATSSTAGSSRSP
jgi:hypothetical protein